MLDATHKDGKDLITDLEVAVSQVLVIVFHADKFIYLQFLK